MALPTFAPDPRPSPGGVQRPQIALLKPEFGDGYTQRRPKGLNHVRRVVTLRWDALTLGQMEAIRDFLEERGGFKPFLYQPHGEAPGRWTCEEWEAENGPPWTLRAMLLEDFGLAE